MRSPLFLPAILVTMASLPAQNLVKNGDFETGNTTGWTFGGYTLNAKVDGFDTTGGGSSQCFNNLPGGQTTPAPYPVNWMETDVLIIQGIVHEFRADIACNQTYATNADGGTIEAFVDGVKVATHAFGSITVNTTERTRMCGRIVPTTTGQKKLRITFHRNYLTAVGRTPTCYIDNIFLGRTNGPTICFPGERKAGSNVQIQVNGTASNRFAIFIGIAQQTPPLPISGFTGQWELKSPYFPLVISNLDANGLWSFSTLVPAAAQGAKAWVQGVQVGTAPPVHLGFGQEVNVY